MEKRKIIFGTYDTAAHGWTLSAWRLGEAAQKTRYVEKEGGDGSWDYSTALTDGILRYGDRPLSVTLTGSTGDRLSREDEIRRMINELDGLRPDIYLPDDPNHHVTGRLHVVREFNNPAYAQVSVSATCDPWKYANKETSVNLTATATAQKARLVNNGKRAVVPVLTVTGSNVLLAFGASSLALSAGTHQWPDLLLTTGAHELTYSGTGSVRITYREAVLE